MATQFIAYTPPATNCASFSTALATYLDANQRLEHCRSEAARAAYRTAVRRLIALPAPDIAGLAAKIAASDPFDLDDRAVILADARRLAGLSVRRRVIKTARPMIEACAELDAAEAAAWDRLGGPSEADEVAIDALELEIGHRPAETPAVALWRARRLARAVLNEWRADLADALALTLERDIASLS